MARQIAQTLREVYGESAASPDTPAVCPHCGVVSTRDRAIASGVQDCEMPDGRTVMSCFVEICMACSCFSFGVRALKSRHDQRTAENLLIWPYELLPDRAPRDLEEPAKAAYDEARAVLTISPNAAAVLARRCIQGIIRNRLNIRERTLQQEIRAAVARDELTKPARDALDHARVIGNWGAHPDLVAAPNGPPASGENIDRAFVIEDVTREEAEYTLGVVELLFQDLYETPAKSTAMAARIAQKKRT